MTNYFYIATVLFSCTATVYSLDVPQEQSPLGKKPFEPEWRFWKGECGNGLPKAPFELDTTKCTIRWGNNNMSRQEVPIILVEGSDRGLPVNQVSRVVKECLSKAEYLRYPSIVFYHRGYAAFYPVECFLSNLDLVNRADKKFIEKIVDMDKDCINGFKDYHPLKHVFLMIRKNGFEQQYRNIINLFLQYDINLEREFPRHIGIIEDEDKGFENCTPLDYFDNAKKAKDQKKIRDCNVNDKDIGEIKALLHEKIKSQRIQKEAALKAFSEEYIKQTTSQGGWFSTKTLLWGFLVAGIGFGLYALKNNGNPLLSMHSYLPSGAKSISIRRYLLG